MSITKKHLNPIAKALRQTYVQFSIDPKIDQKSALLQFDILLSELVGILSAANPNFDRAKFYAAVKPTKHEDDYTVDFVKSKN